MSRPPNHRRWLWHPSSTQLSVWRAALGQKTYPQGESGRAGRPPTVLPAEAIHAGLALPHFLHALGPSGRPLTPDVCCSPSRRLSVSPFFHLFSSVFLPRLLHPPSACP